MDGASKATLENEFGVSKEEEVIKKILEGGSIQEAEVRRVLCPMTKQSTEWLLTIICAVPCSFGTQERCPTRFYSHRPGSEIESYISLSV